MVWQIRAIIQSGHPAGARVGVAVRSAVPLFILIFASAYYLVSRDDPSTFTSELTRTDALYFTITVLATVGFGDISPHAEYVRLV